MELRVANEGDVAAILSIYEPYIKNTTITFEIDVPTLDAFKKRFQCITEEFPWLVCEIHGRIVGYAYAEKAFERAAYQWDADIAVYIEAAYQGQGIARKFYRCIEALLILQGYKNIYAAVTGQNDRSMRFHEAAGYHAFANYHNSGYKMGKWLDVIWFEKKLSDYCDNPKSPISFPSMKQEQAAHILGQESKEN